jgi:hypothetical protein
MKMQVLLQTIGQVQRNLFQIQFIELHLLVFKILQLWQKQVKLLQDYRLELLALIIQILAALMMDLMALLEIQ